MTGASASVQSKSTRPAAGTSAAPIAATPPREAARLAALREFGILDTPPDREFDDLAQLASRLLRTPIALVTFVDADRQWFKASVGVDVQQTPRDVSFCAHAIGQDGVFVVEDAARDPRFAANALVTGKPGIRFYAGAPILTDDGHAIGSLCVIDREPRTLDAEGRSLLALLARQAFALVERHYAVGCMSTALANNEELQASVELEHERLGYALDAAGLGWWEWLVPVDTITVGGHFESLFGIEPGGFDGTSDGLVALVHPEDRERIRSAAEEVLAGAPMLDVELRVQQPDGSVRWLAAKGRLTRSSTGKPLKLNGTVHDVTDERRTQEALRESEAMLRAFLDHAPVSMNVRTPDGRYRMVNREFERLFGVSASEAVGRLAVEVLPGWIDARAYQGQTGAVVASGEALRTTHRVRNARGELLDLLTTRFPILGTDGALHAIGTVGVDVGALEDTRRQLAELNANLERRVDERTRELAVTSEELEAFSYAAAHELRAPLRAIVGFCALLMEKDGQDLPPDAASHARRIQVNANRMATLIEKLLDFGRTSRSRVEKRCFDCAGLVRECIADIAPDHAGRGVDLVIDASVDCWADRALLKQVFVNLIGNAFKFTRREKHPRIEIRAETHDGQFVCHVADNGVGFGGLRAERLFQAFHRLHPPNEFEGSGLGLAIAHRIVQLHGGRIWAESAPPGGAAFHFSLPMDATGPRTPMDERTEPLGEPGPGKTPR